MKLSAAALAGASPDSLMANEKKRNADLNREKSHFPSSEVWVYRWVSTEDRLPNAQFLVADASYLHTEPPHPGRSPIQ